MAGLLLVVLLAATGARDASGDAASASDQGSQPRALDLGVPTSRWPADPRGVRQEIGVVLDAMTFWSREASNYTFYSLGLAYLRSSGSWGPFIHLAAFLPLQARQDGRIHSASSVYGRRIGADILLGWQRRWYPSSMAEIELGPGAHLSMLWMPGATGYSDFSAMPLGVGAEAAIRWRTGIHIGRPTLRLGEFLNFATDFYDPLRSNDLRNGFTVVVGVIVGLDD